MNLKRTLLSVIISIASFSAAFASSDSVSAGSGTGKDGKFMKFLQERVNVGGYAQVGYQYDSYSMQKEGAMNRFNLYRAMIIAKIEPVRNLSLNFMADLSRFKLHELYVRYSPAEAFYIRLGQYKTPFTIESNISPSVLETILGAQSVQYLAGIDGSDISFGGGAGRDLGLEAGGAFLKVGKSRHNLLEYRIGIFNGEPFNTAESNHTKDFSASLAVRPVKPLKIHGSVYLGRGTAKADSPYGAFIKGEEYRRNRWSTGLEFMMGPMHFRSEYLEGLDASVKSRGAYATITGSATEYLDIIASVDYLDRNIALSDWQCNYLLGVQWNFFRKCRLQLQYAYQQRSPESKGIFCGVPSSHLVITQLQIGF